MRALLADLLVCSHEVSKKFLVKGPSGNVRINGLADLDEESGAQT